MVLEVVGMAAAGSVPCELGPTDWPVGCCGYAFNLVRPVIPGHRASVLYAMLGQTLVCLDQLFFVPCTDTIR